MIVYPFLSLFFIVVHFQAFMQDATVLHNLHVLSSSGKWVPLGMYTCMVYISL